MARRRDTRIHLEKPGSICMIEHEIEPEKARKILPLDNFLRSFSHFCLLNNPGERRGAKFRLGLYRLHTNSSQYFAAPAYYSPICRPSRYVALNDRVAGKSRAPARG